MSPDKLAYMANQIGKFFLSQEADKTATGIADPRMRVAIFRHLDSGGAGLDPWVREAVAMLNSRTTTTLEAPIKVPREKLNGGNHDYPRQPRRFSRLWRWHSRP
jgi:formate dehydrogenase subunit delta